LLPFSVEDLLTNAAAGLFSARDSVDITDLAGKIAEQVDIELTVTEQQVETQPVLSVAVDEQVRFLASISSDEQPIY
jgi:hypothetical protein